MGYIGTNLGPILSATIAGLILGSIYLVLSKRSREVSQSGSPGYGLGFLSIVCLAEFWLASILAGALILAPTQANPWTMAIGSAVVIWIGFVLPTQLVSYGFRSLPGLSCAADCAHWLVVMVMQAVVLHLIGLTHP